MSMGHMPHMGHLPHMVPPAPPPGPRPVSLEIHDAQAGQWHVQFDSDLAESPSPDASSFTFQTDQTGPANVTDAETLAGQGEPRVLRVTVDAAPASPTGGVLRYNAKGGLRGADGTLSRAFTIKQG